MESVGALMHKLGPGGLSRFSFATLKHSWVLKVGLLKNGVHFLLPWIRFVHAPAVVLMPLAPVYATRECRASADTQPTKASNGTARHASATCHQPIEATLLALTANGLMLNDANVGLCRLFCSPR